MPSLLFSVMDVPLPGSNQHWPAWHTDAAKGPSTPSSRPKKLRVRNFGEPGPRRLIAREFGSRVSRVGSPGMTILRSRCITRAFRPSREGGDRGTRVGTRKQKRACRRSRWLWHVRANRLAALALAQRAGAAPNRPARRSASWLAQTKEPGCAASPALGGRRAEHVSPSANKRGVAVVPGYFEMKNVFPEGTGTERYGTAKVLAAESTGQHIVSPKRDREAARSVVCAEICRLRSQPTERERRP